MTPIFCLIGSWRFLKNMTGKVRITASVIEFMTPLKTIIFIQTWYEPLVIVRSQNYSSGG